MTAGVFAEIARDGKHVVLVVTGDDHEVSQAANLMRHMTPAMKTADGALICPLTWAAVTQLGMTFTGTEASGIWCPQEKLRSWILDEFSWRHGPVTTTPAWPDGLTPRPYQLDAARLIGSASGFLLFDDPGPQPVSARVLTPSGWTIMGDIRAGDEVIGTDGHPHRVLETYDKGIRPVYEITFSDGAKTRADAEHFWAVQTHQMRARVNDKHQVNNKVRDYRFSRGQRWLVKHTSELVSSGSLASFIPVAAPVEFSAKELPLHPYVLGALLGDGSLSTNVPKDGLVRFTTSHEEFAESIGRYVEICKQGNSIHWGVRAGKEVHALGLAGKRSSGKFVPDPYLHSSRKQREDLLRGLMDSDGRVNVRPGRRTKLQWSTTSLVMRDQFIELVRSLGGTAQVMHADERKENTCWIITLELPADISPFDVSYKSLPAKTARTEPARAVRSVRPDGIEHVKCLLIDAPDHLYITDDYIVTSNCGKTAATILGLKVRQLTGIPLWPLVVITPSWEVCDVWAREIAAWAPEWPAPAMYGGPRRAERIGAEILVTTYATAKNDAADAAGPLVKVRAKTVVCDEAHYCVTHDTLLTVPGGVKTISNIRQGDLVRGIDHATGEPAWTVVRDVMRSSLRPVIELDGLKITPEHPVWLSEDSSLCYDQGPDGSYPYLRVVRKSVHEDGIPQLPAAPVLQPELFSQMANVTARVRCVPGDAEEPGGRTPKHRESPSRSESAGEAGCAPERAGQPVPRSVSTAEGTRHAGGTRLAEPEWRERNGAYYPAGDVARLTRTRLDAGASNPNGEVAGLRVPNDLQSGHRAPEAENRNRGAGQGSRKERERPGPEEKRVPGVTGLDSSVDVERADPGRSLWNIETDTGNYFANGILVHNCKNEGAKRTISVQRVADKAKTFVALTGTPVTRDTGDIFPLLAAMDPRSYPSRGRFVKRYLATADSQYGEKIEGLAPLAEPEFRTVLQGQYRRVAKSDVLSQLPPKVYSIRRVELPAEWRRAYDGMAQEMLAELPDGGELPVMTVLAQLTRLGQLSSSAFDVLERPEVNELGQEVKRYDVTLKTPSWKADALLGILAERPGQPVAVFANSAQLILIAGEACQKAGYRCGYIVGSQGRADRHDAIDNFQAGQLDVILCTAGAGGLGITLTAAGTVVMLQRSWELDKALQPEDRAHRMGQQNACVEIIDVVARDTVDSRVRALMREKGGQLGHLVKDPRIVKELLGGLK